MKITVLKILPRMLPRIAALLLLLILSGASLRAQEHRFAGMSDQQFVDHLRELRELRDGSGRAVQPGVRAPQFEDRCGFSLAVETARRLRTAPPALAAEIRALRLPPRLQVNILSPSGRFRVHFDTSGRHVPAMLDAALNRLPNTAYEYADSVAAIFDAVYQKEVVELGFDSPPMRPGESEYQLYILEYNGSFYGETLFDNPLPNSGTVMPTYASYMQIDNDYREFETRGIEALQVTAAHEFHHIVQLGTYGLWGSDTWFHEMTSTYFEEVCYPGINDYLQYIRDFVRDPELSWYQWMPYKGYELVLWPLFLETRYGPDVFRETWENMRRLEPVTATRNAIRDHQPMSGDFASDFCSWAAANFFIGYRSEKAEQQPYADAALFADMQITSSVEFVAETAHLTGLVPPLGAHYLQVYRGVDTLSFVVANTDIAEAITRSAVRVEYDLEVRRSGYDESFTRLSNGWAYKFSAAKENALCVSLLDGGSAAVVERTAPFPNPFNPNEFSRMRFPVPRNIPVNRADLYIYSVSMDLLRRDENAAIELDDESGAFVGWDGRGDDGDFLGSGVYIYTLRYSGGSITGKFAVVVR
jgi:hypothetical protein